MTKAKKKTPKFVPPVNEMQEQPHFPMYFISVPMYRDRKFEHIMLTPVPEHMVKREWDMLELPEVRLGRIEDTNSNRSGEKMNYDRTPNIGD